MQINATFATTATAGEEQAVATAINYIDSNYNVDENVTFDMTFGTAKLGAGTAGENTASFYNVSYSALEGALYAKDSAPGSTPVQQAAAASLPTSDPTGGTGHFYVTEAYGRMLGLSGIPAASASAPDATVDLNSSLNYTYTSAGGSTGSTIAAGTYDAVGVLEHEITEALGRSDIGGANTFGDGADYSSLDLFRYTAAPSTAGVQPTGTSVGHRDEPFDPNYKVNDQSYFSYNGSTVTLPYDSGIRRRRRRHR